MFFRSGCAFDSYLYCSDRTILSEQRNGTMYLGSAGVFSMLLALVAFILAVKSLGEENSYKFFPYIATVLSFLGLGIWVALYVAGFLL